MFATYLPVRYGTMESRSRERDRLIRVSAYAGWGEGGVVFRTISILSNMWRGQLLIIPAIELIIIIRKIMALFNLLEMLRAFISRPYAATFGYLRVRWVKVLYFYFFRTVMRRKCRSFAWREFVVPSGIHSSIC